ncbi:ABC transporter ATP-binding protein/permease [Legionella cincinnatiensis]|uniref:ABC transporter n=1 Tax=Legionella cincinnatiensis TaxID=28085 RepID=A0A378IM34_9GAMM|nr:SbmA/BacA-like family transporter [Legionella cincinnatiensis]KTC89269.1 ABC transporter [Legionella cincinnatiensis]STX36308.1 ABC transporter [Legionella cincinnatiensis]
MTSEVRTIKTKKSSYLKKALQLFNDYFIHSDQKLIAWSFFIGIILCEISLFALGSLFIPWCFMGLWTAWMAKELSALLFYCGIVVLTSAVIVAVTTLKDYLAETLSIKWRVWLSSKYINKYLFGEKNYLNLSRETLHVDDPEQRIQENFKNFIRLTLSLSTGFIRSSIALPVLITLLWVVGGSVTLMILGTNIFIPGYLVWLSLLAAVIPMIITPMLGKSLPALNQQNESAEAQFRKDLEFVHNDAENIALEAGEKYHKNILDHDLEKISQNAFQRLWVNLKLNAFQLAYTHISWLFPYLFTAPVYFAGFIELAQFTQINFAISEISTALSWFFNSHSLFKEYQTSVERITELEEAFDKESSDVSKKNIHIKENHSERLTVKNLTIDYPNSSSTQHIMNNLNLEFKPGENILIKAPSGYGKSTLFKTIGGIWRYGTGEISIPPHQKTYFLPQKPSIPHDSLKAVLAYPELSNAYTDREYEEVLSAVGGNMHQFISELDKKDTWSKRLSLGQQERISFARALLKKPDWLFLDEATASLDEESEKQLYSLLKKKLPKTTVISIAHRSTVMEFHDRILTLHNPSPETSAVLSL